MAPNRQYQQYQGAPQQYHGYGPDPQTQYSHHYSQSTDYTQRPSPRTASPRSPRPQMKDRSPSRHTQPARRSRSKSNLSPQIISPPLPRSNARSSPLATPSEEVTTYFPPTPKSQGYGNYPSQHHSQASGGFDNHAGLGLSQSADSGNMSAPQNKERKGSHDLPKKVGSALKRFFVKKDESDGEVEFEQIGNAKHWTDM